MSCTVDEFALAILILSGMYAEDEVEQRFCQEDRDLLFSWFDSVWTDEEDKRIIEQGMSTLEKKLKELKGI